MVGTWMGDQGTSQSYKLDQKVENIPKEEQQKDNFVFLPNKVWR